jgi:hypothetical protein
LIILCGTACQGPRRADHRAISVGTSICREIRIVPAAGAVAEDHLTVIDGKGHATMPSLPRELAKIQDVFVSPAKDLALVVSVGEGHPWINVYRIADWLAPLPPGSEGVEPFLTMDPYPFSWTDIAWRSRDEVAFRSEGDYARFDRAARRPGGEIGAPEKAWIWNVAANTVVPGKSQR